MGINKASYPELFGNVTGSYGYAVLGISAITTVVGKTTTINNGNYGTPAGGFITGTYSGTNSNEVNEPNSSAAQGELTQLIADLNNLSPDTPLPTPVGGVLTLYSNTKYVANAVTNFSGSIVFDAGGDPTAQFYVITTSSILFNNVTMTLQGGAQSGNIFWLANGSVITFTNSNGNGIFIGTTQVSFASPTIINGNIFTKGSVIFNDNTTINSTNVCYLKGSKILTENGYVAIENLVIGDKVVTKGKIHDHKYIDLEEFSYKPVIWTGKFSPPNLTSETLPICIKANALGENLPLEDLYVSPGHRILLDGKMTFANSLINEKSIYQDKDRISVEYYHLELESHFAVVANGILAESYIDVNNRYVFDK